MTFDDYEKTLFIDTEPKKHTMRVIRSKEHNLKTFEITKKSISCYDYKRYILDDGITTRAYG